MVVIFVESAFDLEGVTPAPEGVDGVTDSSYDESEFSPKRLVAIEYTYMLRRRSTRNAWFLILVDAKISLYEPPRP